MKQQYGFVSNSSSTSFVLIGTKITKDLEPLMHQYEESQDNMELDIVTDDDTSFIGKIIAKCKEGEDCMPSTDTIPSTVITKVSTLLIKIGVTHPIIHLYTGSMES